MESNYIVIESETGMFDVCCIDGDTQSFAGAEVIREGFETEHDANLFVERLCA